MLLSLALSATGTPFFTDISTLDPSQISSMISSPSPSDQVGMDISIVGDFNNDGFQDIIVSAKRYSNAAGIVYVIFGTSKGIESIDLGTTDPYASNRGFKIIGESSSLLGGSIANAGDFNHDGIDDIIIGAPASSAAVGKVYIIYGRSSGSTDINLNTDDIITLQRGLTITGVSGSTSTSQFGRTVSSAGDMNKDGIADIVISAYVGTKIGVAYDIFGGKHGYTNFDLNTISLSTSSLGFKITGTSAAAGFFHLSE